VSGLSRVTYLVEVCDPCEAEKYAYEVNGVRLSDFITPHYYDPNGATGVQYSFRGSIKEPHTVLEGGYVSFGNPVDNHWYQIIIDGGKPVVRDLGIIATTQGKSLREFIDGIVREKLKDKYYRTEAPISRGAAMTAAASRSPLAESSAARAKLLRDYVKELK
jgi:hypothetical protein